MYPPTQDSSDAKSLAESTETDIFVQAIESIEYRDGPLSVLSATIRAKILKQGVSTTENLSHQELVKKEGGKEALRKFNPLFSS